MNKQILTILAICSLASVPAMALGPIEQYFFGSGFLSAEKACPSLGINKGDELTIAADSNRFLLGKIAPDQMDLDPVITLAVPSQGTYVFDDPDFPTTNEIKAGLMDIKMEVGSGDVIIKVGRISCKLSNANSF